MNPTRFDALSRTVSTTVTRRRGLVALLGALTAGWGSTVTAAPLPDAACRRLGKRCTGRHRRGSCCGGATCRLGRCRCGRRQQACQGTCLAKAACCRNADCPAGEICGEGSCGCVPDPTACVPFPQPCPDGDCGRCCSGTGAEVGGGFICSSQVPGDPCGAGVECDGQGRWTDCVCNRCCTRSGENATLRGTCATCCSGACDDSGRLCA